MAATDDNSLEGIDQLTEAVKSRILDRVILDLRDALKLGARTEGYTKSDSGIYGKYQKHDPVDLTRVLDAIKAETERLLAEHVEKLKAANHEPDNREKP